MKRLYVVIILCCTILISNCNVFEGEIQSYLDNDCKKSGNLEDLEEYLLQIDPDLVCSPLVEKTTQAPTANLVASGLGNFAKLKYETDCDKNHYNLGKSVAVSANRMVVGGDLASGRLGAVYIYQREGEGNEWIFQQQLTANDGVRHDHFGFSVDIDPTGNLIVVGAYAHDLKLNLLQDVGAVYIFKYNKEINNWEQIEKFTSPEPQLKGYFGYSVAIDQGVVIVGEPYHRNDIESNIGKVYVFHPIINENKVNWSRHFGLVPNKTTSANFGWSVDIRNGRIIVGSPGDYNYQGSSYIYSWSEEKENFKLESVLTAYDKTENDYFGFSVGISHDHAVVGAFGDDDYGELSGAAYIFQHTSQGWLESQKLISDTPMTGDFFGQRVAISGQIILVGSFFEYSKNTTGTTYMFQHDGYSWKQASKINGEVGNKSDYFGWDMAITGKDLIVSAPYVNSADDKINCGAAYVFRDIKAPSNPTISVNNNFGYTDSRSVRLSLAAEGSPSYVYISNSEDCAINGEWYLYNPSITWIFPKQLKPSNNVSVKYSDLSGNESSCISATIKKDTIQLTDFDINKPSLKLTMDSSQTIIEWDSITNMIYYQLSILDKEKKQIYRSEPLNSKRDVINVIIDNAFDNRELSLILEFAENNISTHYAFFYDLNKDIESFPVVQNYIEISPTTASKQFLDKNGKARYIPIVLSTPANDPVFNFTYQSATVPYNMILVNEKRYVAKALIFNLANTSELVFTENFDKVYLKDDQADEVDIEQYIQDQYQDSKKGTKWAESIFIQLRDIDFRYALEKETTRYRDSVVQGDQNPDIDKIKTYIEQYKKTNNVDNIYAHPFTKLALDQSPLTKLYNEESIFPMIDKNEVTLIRFGSTRSYTPEFISDLTSENKITLFNLISNDMEESFLNNDPCGFGLVAGPDACMLNDPESIRGIRTRGGISSQGKIGEIFIKKKPSPPPGLPDIAPWKKGEPRPPPPIPVTTPWRVGEEGPPPPPPDDLIKVPPPRPVPEIHRGNIADLLMQVYEIDEDVFINLDDPNDKALPQIEQAWDNEFGELGEYSGSQAKYTVEGIKDGIRDLARDYPDVAIALISEHFESGREGPSIKITAIPDLLDMGDRVFMPDDLRDPSMISLSPASIINGTPGGYLDKSRELFDEQGQSLGLAVEPITLGETLLHESLHHIYYQKDMNFGDNSWSSELKEEEQVVDVVDGFRTLQGRPQRIHYENYSYGQQLTPQLDTYTSSVEILKSPNKILQDTPLQDFLDQYKLDTSDPRNTWYGWHPDGGF